MIMVKRGESVFNIPATELSILVCAVANKKAGIKIPINPEASSLYESPGLISLNFIRPTGKRNRNAAVTRNAPNSFGSKTLRPCLIRMNDVPQIRASSRSKPSAV